MQHITKTATSSPFQSIARAEDTGQPSRWDSLCEGVLIPLGSLFAIFLAMVSVMLMTH